MKRLLAVAAFMLFTLALLPGARCADHVQMALGWLPQADFGGFFQAKVDGTYDRAGLDVDLVSGNQQNGGIMLMASGQYDFVRISNSGVALAMASAHLPYVVIAAIYQKDATTIIVHDTPDAPASLAALRGYPVMISPEAMDNYWAFLVQKYGFRNSQIRRYTGNPAGFVADSTVATQGYVTSDLPRLKEAGVPVKDFFLADAGYSAYGTLLVARKDLVEQHPDMVQRFLDATLAGWCSYLHGDRTKADAMIVSGNPDYTLLNAADAVAAINKFGLVEGAEAKEHGIGYMTEARWREYLSQMKDTGLYSPDINLSSVYTTRFLHDTKCIRVSGGM